MISIYHGLPQEKLKVLSGYKVHVMDKVTQNPPLYIALHWDGKLTTTRLGSKYEVLAVIASGSASYTNGKLLGITRLDSPTGITQAETSHDMFQLRQLADNVRVLVFDTTASNSGWKQWQQNCLQKNSDVNSFIMLVGTTSMNLL